MLYKLLHFDLKAIPHKNKHHPLVAILKLMDQIHHPHMDQIQYPDHQLLNSFVAPPAQSHMTTHPI